MNVDSTLDTGKKLACIGTMCKDEERIVKFTIKCCLVHANGDAMFENALAILWGFKEARRAGISKVIVESNSSNFVFELNIYISSFFGLF